MHSISTSVPKGNWKTATQVLACESISAVVRKIDGLLAYGLGIPGKELIVGLVHKSKVLHVCDVNIHLDDVFQIASRLFEDSFEILDRLSLQRQHT